MGDPKAPSWKGLRDDVHPQAPAGPPGLGRFGSPLSLGDPLARSYRSRPELATPPGIFESWWGTVSDDAVWAAESLISLKDRAMAVLKAFELARYRYVAKAILEETGRALGELLAGMLQGLLLMLAVLVTTTAIGGIAGAVIGALAGGVGAIPGAAAGAEAGLAAGLAILEWLGIGFLIVYISTKLDEVVTKLSHAVTVAWNAGHSGRPREADIEAAAREIAKAVAILVRLILEGIVLYLTAIGAAAVAERVPVLVGKLKASKLGAGFAEWVEKNYKSLIDDARLNPKLRQGSGQGKPAASETPSQPKPSEEKPPVGATVARVVSRQEAEEILVSKGMSQARAKDFVASFDDGPITVRETQAGETFYRYSGTPDGKGSFLTQTKYANPQEAVDGLHLGPYNNPATYRQPVTATGPSTVLEGGVRNGVPPGARQTVVTGMDSFQYGEGVTY